MTGDESGHGEQLRRLYEDDLRWHRKHLADTEAVSERLRREGFQLPTQTDAYVKRLRDGITRLEELLTERADDTETT